MSFAAFTSVRHSLRQPHTAGPGAASRCGLWSMSYPCPTARSRADRSRAPRDNRAAAVRTSAQNRLPGPTGAAAPGASPGVPARRSSLSSSSQVPCQSSASTQLTPVTKQLESMLRRTWPVSGSIDEPATVGVARARSFGGQ